MKIKTTKVRSRIMASIRGSGNKSTELRLASIMRRHGIYGWRRNYPIYGRPDFVFPSIRLAVFVDGCFWHACPVHGRQPLSNGEFWSAKLEANRRRDGNVSATLMFHGWTVLRFWEHELDSWHEDKTVTKILNSTLDAVQEPLR
jgi:DNA mismatch endonuclease, patch repair protein